VCVCWGGGERGECDWGPGRGFEGPGRGWGSVCGLFEGGIVGAYVGHELVRHIMQMRDVGVWVGGYICDG